MEYIKFKNLLQHNNKSKLHASDSVDNGKYPFFTSSNKITKTTNEPDYFEKALVIGNGGSANIHYVDVPFSVTSHCYVYSEKFENEINIKYVYYYLSSNLYLIERGFKGAGLRNVSRKYIEEIPIPIVDLETQDKIVAVLDKAKSLIDKREQTIQKFDELLGSTFFHMFGNPVKNENGFDVSILKNFAKVRIGPFGSLLHQEDYVVGGVPLVNPTHIKDGKIYIDPEMTVSPEKMLDLKNYILAVGDVILGRRGEIGRSAVINEKEKGYLCGTGSIFIRPNKDLLAIYLHNVISSNSMKFKLFNLAKGVTMKNLNSNIIENLEIPIPPLFFQQKFSKIVSKIETSKEKLNQSKNQLENLLNGLSQIAFNGELQFNTAVDLEILMENDYDFFKKHADKKAIQLLLDRMDKNILNKKKFYEEELYDKAKMFVFNLLEDKKIEQVYEQERIKLVVK